MSEIKKFQVNLDSDKEAKNMFIDNEVRSDSDKCSSEDEDRVKIISHRKSGKKGAIETMLFERMVSQQHEFLRAKKTIYRLQSEIDIEEVKTRYLKLDLNNLQVQLDGEILKNKNTSVVQLENMTLRVVIVLYVLWCIFSRIM
jgi:hypothetical protein